MRLDVIILRALNVVEKKSLFLLTSDSVKYWYSPIYENPSISFKEAGIALYKNGFLIDYQHNYQNIRVISDNSSDDVFCEQSRFKFKAHRFIINYCGWKFVFKIIKLTQDSLMLKEITHYRYFPDSIPIIYIRSNDQNTRPIYGPLLDPDTNNWPVKFFLKKQ